jgi:hypothetical protein
MPRSLDFSVDSSASAQQIHAAFAEHRQRIGRCDLQGSSSKRAIHC